MTSSHSHTESLQKVFSRFQNHLEEEQNTRESIRETTRELEKTSKVILSTLQGINQELSKVESICLEGRKLLEEKVKGEYSRLNDKVPAGEYCRYNEMWRGITSRLCTCCSLIIYLEKEELAERAVVAEMLGLKMTRNEENIYLDTEDYLVGLLGMASELSRFTINSVTNGDFERPSKVGKFLTDLNNGFLELNFKNDFLRKKYDSLKYELKKVEEVVYDVKIRGLASAPAQPQQPSSSS